MSNIMATLVKTPDQRVRISAAQVRIWWPISRSTIRSWQMSCCLKLCSGRCTSFLPLGQSPPAVLRETPLVWLEFSEKWNGVA